LIKDFCSAHFGFDPPWWIVAVALVAITIGINLIGIRAAVRTQLTLVTASVVPFLILAVAVVVDGGPNGNSADAFNAGTIAEGGSVLKGLLVAIVMFVGFELAASLGEETARPHRSIPIAIIASIVICAAFYVLTLYVGTIGSGGPDRLPFDFAELARSYVGRWLGVLIELAIILDVIAVGIGFAAATSRGLLTLARDGVLPSRLAAVNDVAVPMNAAYTVAGCGLVGIVIGLVVYGTSTTAGSPDVVDQFLVTTTIGAFVICVVYALVAIGGIAFFAREDLQPAAVVAGLVGLVTAGAGVTAQFVDGTAPVGDARWGRHLGLVVLAVVAVWLGVTTARRRTAVRPAGDRAIGPAA
jgi:amino acid transporter